MDNFILSVYAFITVLVGQFSRATDNKTGFSRKQTTTGGNSSTTNGSHCSNLYHTAFGCWQGKPTIKEGVCATYNDAKEVVSTIGCPSFHRNRYKFATPLNFCCKNPSCSFFAQMTTHSAWAAEPVRLVMFWPDHFFTLLIIHKMRGISLGLICFLEITAIFSLCLVKHSSAVTACQ